MTTTLLRLGNALTIKWGRERSVVVALRLQPWVGAVELPHFIGSPRLGAFRYLHLTILIIMPITGLDQVPAYPSMCTNPFRISLSGKAVDTSVRPES